jgi:hypothetical protein
MIEAIVASLAASATAMAQDKLFDNSNAQACGFTDTATFDLQAPAHLDRIEVWYRWRDREASIPYTILHDRQQVRAGTLHRAECDPFQEAWCAARDSVDIDAGPGRYAIRTAPRVCQNQGSGGAGFVKVFGHPSRFGDERRRDAGNLPADVWRIEEGAGARVIWVGTWTRRGRSDVFDAVWRNVDTRAEARDTLRLVEARDRIVFHRDGVNGEYRGELSRDGRHMSGTASWYSADGFWRADVLDGRQPDPGQRRSAPSP